MNEKKKPAQPKKPEHTIRVGDVLASIHIQQSNSGFTYRSFSINRIWRAKTTAKETSGDTFFENNQYDCQEAVRQACEWIRNRVSPSAPETLPVTSEETRV